MINRMFQNTRAGLVPIMLMAMLCGLTPTQALAQPFDYLNQALAKVVLASAVVSGEYDYVDGNCLYGAYLANGNSRNLSHPFRGGEDYLIIGAADEDMIDLDLAVTTANGKVIAEDSSFGPVSVLPYSPSESGNRTIRLTNSASLRNSFCAMLILHRTPNGNDSFGQIIEALDNVIQTGRLSSALTTASGFAENTFCLFGGRVDQGQNMGLYDISLQSGKYTFLATGSENISDVDIFVTKQYQYDEMAGETVCNDNDSHRIAICDFWANSGNYYYLRYRNYASQGAGFVFSILLKQ